MYLYARPGMVGKFLLEDTWNEPSGFNIFAPAIPVFALTERKRYSSLKVSFFTSVSGLRIQI